MDLRRDELRGRVETLLGGEKKGVTRRKRKRVKEKEGDGIRRFVFINAFSRK